MLTMDTSALNIDLRPWLQVRTYNDSTGNAVLVVYRSVECCRDGDPLYEPVREWIDTRAGVLVGRGEHVDPSGEMFARCEWLFYEATA